MQTVSVVVVVFVTLVGFSLGIVFVAAGNARAENATAEGVENGTDRVASERDGKQYTWEKKISLS